ncbi:MAG: hypothetical protein NVS2B16_21490 [Chloroflexota bacterium]
MIHVLNYPGFDRTTTVDGAAPVHTRSGLATADIRFGQGCHMAQPGGGVTTHAATTYTTSVKSSRQDKTTASAARAVGVYGGIIVALGLGILEPPLAVLMAITPLLRKVSAGEQTTQPNAFTDLLDGAVTPIVGEGLVPVAVHAVPSVLGRGLRFLTGGAQSIWADAQALV